MVEKRSSSCKFNFVSLLKVFICPTLEHGPANWGLTRWTSHQVEAKFVNYDWGLATFRGLFLHYICSLFNLKKSIVTRDSNWNVFTFDKISHDYQGSQAYAFGLFSYVRRLQFPKNFDCPCFWFLTLQMDMLRGLKMDASNKIVNNYRPVLPLNDRTVKSSFVPTEVAADGVALKTSKVILLPILLGVLFKL